MRRVDLLYLVLLLVILLLHYIIPYTILRDSQSIALLMYWIALVSLWALVSGFYIEKRLR